MLFIYFIGYDFNKGVDHNGLLNSYLTSGFQATSFGNAVEEIKKMVRIVTYFVLILI